MVLIWETGAHEVLETGRGLVIPSREAHRFFRRANYGDSLLNSTLVLHPEASFRGANRAADALLGELR